MYRWPGFWPTMIFQLFWSVIGKSILRKFEEDQIKIVTSRLLTRFVRVCTSALVINWKLKNVWLRRRPRHPEEYNTRAKNESQRHPKQFFRNWMITCWFLSRKLFYYFNAFYAYFNQYSNMLLWHSV
jgi:hypothetical protein